eukprot:2493080-Amphidinium_carterae.1
MGQTPGQLQAIWQCQLRLACEGLQRPRLWMMRGEEAFNDVIDWPYCLMKDGSEWYLRPVVQHAQGQGICATRSMLRSCSADIAHGPWGSLVQKARLWSETMSRST